MPDPIEKQYVKHPYPLPIHDMAERLKSGTHKEASGMDLVWNKLFPEKVYSDQLDVLIAGCGTNQAVYHALKFPSSNYYAIDVSQTSIDHVKKMIKMYDIKNLDVERREIEDLTDEKAFDYVISTGVIHHTANPEQSLRKLVHATRDDGALFIMVYASYLRTGVYLLQDVFRYLELENDDAGIKAVLSILDLLPEKHFAQKYIEGIKNSSGTRDLTFKSGVVDTFLNARDVAFNIIDLKKLIASAGAYFQCWEDNIFYYRELFNFDNTPEYAKRYANLDPWQLDDFTQKISLDSGKLTFTLRRKRNFEHMWFKQEDLTSSTFIHQAQIIKALNPNATMTDNLVLTTPHGTVKLNELETLVWNSAGSTLENLTSRANLTTARAGRGEHSLRDYKSTIHKLWRRGVLEFSTRDTRILQ